MSAILFFGFNRVVALVAFSLLLVDTRAAKLGQTVSAHVAANPIRKVVNMLTALKEKVEAEAEHEEALYKKYMCYCKTSSGALSGSIADAETKVPEVSSSLKEAGAAKVQLEEDLVAHKADRQAAKEAMAEAKAIREKEAATFAAVKASYGEDIAAIEGAVAALEKGVAGSFLQDAGALRLQHVLKSRSDILDEDSRLELAAFLQGGSAYAPQSGQIIGILKQMGDEMAKGLSEETATEKSAIEAYDGLMAAKSKEVAALTEAIEEKSTRAGSLGVSIAEMKAELSDTEASLAEDKAFLADMEANCDSKTKEWDAIVKARSEEVVALSDTIKILNEDESLELFKKTLPSSAASLVQLQVDGGSFRARALDALGSPTGRHSPSLDFIALALRGKKVGFEKVLTMIDDMLAVLKKDQIADEDKKQYCAKEFDTSDDKKKELELAVSDAEKSIELAESGLSSLISEIEALKDSIAALDKMVSEASEQRKNENAEFTELMAQDTAAKDLIGVAKNRLNEFYNPKLFLPPPAFVQVSMHRSKEAPPPPPESFGAYSKKSEESGGVIAMLDLLVKDLDKEMTVAETEEKESQAEYEKMMEDSKAKRTDDSKLLSDKEAAKADTEGELQTAKDSKASSSKELTGTLEYIASLHADCDWLVKYFDARKEARAGEISSLENAKAVLSGADFSFLQKVALSSARLRGANIKPVWHE